MTEQARQHLSFRETPRGTVAVLTVELGGQRYVYESAPYSDASIDRVAAAYATLEADAVEGIFGDIWRGVKKAVKGVGKVAKSIATSDVFRVAAKGLAVIAPALGPFAPAAIGVSAGMGVASKLASAATAAKGGAKKAARKLAKAAARDAMRIHRGDKKAAKALLQTANVKRKNADTVIAADKTPARASGSKRLRSNRPGSVTKADLAHAKHEGRLLVARPKRVPSQRVFWVH